MEARLPSPAIRAAASGDLAALQRIEVEAGARFADVGMREVAQHPPHDRAELAEAVAGGLLWVVEVGAGGLAGFALARRLTRSLHLEELAVLPAHGRRGLGAALVCHVAGVAKALGYAQLTLSTFERVPWNAPYYARLGFEVVPAAAFDADLRAVRRDEAAAGLAVDERVIMRLAVDVPGPCSETT